MNKAHEFSRPVGARRRLGAAILWASLLVGSSSVGASGGRSLEVEVPLSEMVVVPAGPFVMGAPDPEDSEFFVKACMADFGDALDTWCHEEGILLAPSRPRREVVLPAFVIDRYEVAVEDYRACVDLGACDATPLVEGDQRYNQPGYPIGNVAYQDAVDYCRFRNKRLPTEAEFEKAARGTDERRLPWGTHWRERRANMGRIDTTAFGKAAYGTSWQGVTGTGDERDGHASAAPVGAMTFSDGPYGAFDLTGNVYEWVSDAFSQELGYEGLDVVSPERRASTGLRVIRGGSWKSSRFFGYVFVRRALRESQRSVDLGFRCARDAH